MKFIIHPEDTSRSHLLGAKAGALAALQTARLPIPAWFVIAADGQLNDAAQRELAQALNELCPNGEPVAVRSSATDEDGAAHSFAGQYESFLFVALDDVPAKVVAVRQSARNERVLAYRRERGVEVAPRPPAVLIQRMINADAAGVAFSADPVGGRHGTAVVSATRGVGAALVAGECDGETWRIDRAGKIIEHDCAAAPVLNDEQVKAVAELARRAERFFQRPQDIEWAIEDGRLYLLQARPITTLAAKADPDGIFNLWDNSNIAESYGGVTTPLTFSFARRAYEEVYRQFCRELWVDEAQIAAHDQTFKQMLGLLRGRVYYNLLNWYRVLALLPGFKLNRRFMEQMMGVKEGLPEALVAELESGGWRERARDAANLALTLGGLLVNHFRLPRRIERFYERLDNALHQTAPLDEMRADELAAHYRSLEAQLLTRWDAPLINDFFAMIHYGLLRRLSEKWCGDDGLHNSLLCGTGGMISAEPARRVREMARLAAADERFVALLCGGSLAAIIERMDEHGEFKAGYQSYLDKFGDRCLDELKLESATLHDDPLLLLRSVGQLGTHRAASAADAFLPAGIRPAPRPHAGSDAYPGALRGRPLRRLIFNWVLRHARARVRDRENLRFERTRLFGRVRRILLEIGRRFYALDLLDDPRDVFYLEVEEALGFIAGTTTTTALRELVAVRQAEFAAHRNADAPAVRCTTRGIVHQGNSLQAESRVAAVAFGAQLKGTGCSPGVVRGRVRVIADPRGVKLEHGEIIVAEHTDPGWVMLFPAAAGLLVERGSLLSHSAIVARELGLPAIVALAGVTQWLTDGDEVEFDGATGVVSKLPQLSVVSCQLSVVSRQWAVGSGR